MIVKNEIAEYMYGEEVMIMNQITVYTTSTCPYCSMMKNFLASQGLHFQEVSVEGNPALMQQLASVTGHTGVPQTNINGQWVFGFKPQAVAQMLGGSIPFIQ